MSTFSGGYVVLDSKDDKVQARGARGANHGPALGFIHWGILSLYAAAICLAVAHHEPWADEAQAWLIAKSLPFWRMFWGQVRYEGTPGLWHSLLWLLSHAGLPYSSMLWLSAALAIGACWFFLTYSPFPLILRALIPFTFYLCYQFAVVARSYVLMPLLVFATIHLIRTASKRKILFGVVDGLLANCNVFGLFLSFGLMVLYLWQLRSEPMRDGGVRASLLKNALPYLAFVVLALGTAYPPKDLRFVPTPLGDLVNRHRGVATPAPIGSSALEAPFRQRIQEYTTPISHSFWIGIVFIGVIIWQLQSRKRLIALVPLGFLILSFELVYKMPRHMGIFLVALLGVMWLGWPERDTPLRKYRVPDLACAAMLFLICLPQVAWSARAIQWDVTQNYSGSEACANYLKANAAGRTVFGYDYFTVAVSPFFANPVFQNQASPFWSWSVTNTNDLQMDRILTDKPDFVVLAWHQNAQFGFLISSTLSPRVEEMQNYVQAIGYENVATFTGAQPMRSSFAEKDVFTVYRRPDLTPLEWELVKAQLSDPPKIQH